VIGKDDALAESGALAAAAEALTSRHAFIDGLTWPDGHRIAVNFTCDFDAMLLRRVLEEPTLQRARGEFGGRVGIWRLIELFDATGVQATIFTPGRICELYPDAVAAAARSGHEIADHMWEHRVPKERDLELDHIRRSTAALTQTAGRRPVGSRSRHSADLLLAQGYCYRSHGSPHHLPSYERAGDAWLINLPFHYAIDDAMFFSFAWQGSENAAQRITDPDRVLELWWAAFEQQYASGGYLNVCLHPFVSGRALRIAMLEELIRRMQRRPGVWLTSCEAVARHCLAHFPAPRARPVP